MAEFVLEQQKSDINAQSTSIARLALILAKNPQLSEQDFLPFGANPYPHLMRSTATILKRLIKQEALPKHVMIAAKLTLKNK